MTAIPGPGIRAIAEERVRQIAEEGWSAEHDDEHSDGQMGYAAMCYLREALGMDGIFDWPWDEEWWKPADNQLRNLEKAGALIAAEYDRIYRGLGL
jgi:hypothetical protein